MCGRYTLIRLADFIDIFPWIHPPKDPPPDRYNIAPTQSIAVVPNDGSDTVQFFHWGLIPSWAKDPSIGSRMINARAETLAEKPAFRNALKRRRCLIPASGFYEWQKLADGKTKQPMYIRMRSKSPFAFAGLWETWRDDQGNEIPSCTIITTQPNSVCRDIHDRMPAVLRPENYKKWLATGEQKPEELVSLLGPYPAEEMEAFPVNNTVNVPSRDSPDCFEAIVEGDQISPPAKSPRKTRVKRDPGPGLFG